LTRLHQWHVGSSARMMALLRLYSGLLYWLMLCVVFPPLARPPEGSCFHYNGLSVLDVSPRDL
jgi:hypothetical protein